MTASSSRRAPAATPTGVETLRWRDGRLEMIDQRVLPMRFEYVACGSAAEVADAIRTMVVRGAPAIGCAAAYGVALEALRLQHLPRREFLNGLEAAFDALAASRPTAVNLFWALAQMRSVLKRAAEAAPPQIAARLLDEAHAILAADVQANRALGAHGSALLPESVCVLTYCNAGALATAGHGTALGVVRSAVAAGKRISVIACETRPFLQGARLTVWELMQDNIPVTLITDNMAGHLMSRGEVGAVIVGADRVAANGDFANKIGTYAVAVLAQRHRIPFYVAAPLSTIDLKLASGETIPIEERGADEVRGFADARWAPPQAAVRNPAFDVTPAELVSALITESGVVHAPDAAGIAALFSRAA
ncbi:MAG TPA: S-methyl-5-thioribose-1-phosphate isomerase [Burkholderiales bacterium]|nr:S-methyl-5-thioribose-1-phosphate isomerase [Burkholderiales bacterium]